MCNKLEEVRTIASTIAAVVGTVSLVILWEFVVPK